jgi:hypothetical protein
MIGRLVRVVAWHRYNYLMAANWKVELHAEFDRAESARAAGKEGQARVCARRAAGIAIREYLTRRGYPNTSASAYDLLNLFSGLPGVAPDLKLIADHLTLRVTEEFELPVEADLVAEAYTLCVSLMPELLERE